MTHYKLTEAPIGVEWTKCDTDNTGWPFYKLINEKQKETFPELNKPILVQNLNKLGEVNYWRTIMTSDLECRHVLIKWYITHWSYE